MGGAVHPSDPVEIGWIAVENRALKRTLAEFEARGITRRSESRKSELHKSAA